MKDSSIYHVWWENSYIDVCLLHAEREEKTSLDMEH